MYSGILYVLICLLAVWISTLPDSYLFCLSSLIALQDSLYILDTRPPSGMLLKLSDCGLPFHSFNGTFDKQKFGKDQFIYLFISVYPV